MFSRVRDCPSWSTHAYDWVLQPLWLPLFKIARIVCEVSEIVDNDTTVIDDDTSDDKVSGGNNKTIDAMFLHAAQDIMNQVRRKVGTVAREDRRFREHIGAPFAIVRMVWDMLEEGDLLLDKREPKHLLWMLYFLKCYPEEGPSCTAIEGTKGAINPKMMRKWVWLFLEHICELEDEVVSLFVPPCILQASSHPLCALSLLSCKTADQLQEPSHQQQAEQLTDDGQWHQLSHPAEGGRQQG
jgi:hypothetical protein